MKLAIQYLEKQQKTVVQPLLEKLESLGKLKFEQGEEIKGLRGNLKILQAILRTPKLCDIFHKTEKRRQTEQNIQTENQRAFKFLRTLNIDETNATSFIEKLANDIHVQLQTTKK